MALYGANHLATAPDPEPAADVWVTQGEVPPATVAGVLAAARATGAIALVTPSPAGRLDADLVARFDVAVVNETELAALGERRPPAVVLTLGARGARILPDGPGLPALPARVVDTTGAGDCLTGATAAALAEGRPLVDGRAARARRRRDLRRAARMSARDADAGRGRAAAQLTFLTPCTGRPRARHWNRVMVGSVSS